MTKKVLLPLFVVGVVAIVANALYKSYLGKGDLVVFAPLELEARVSLDGASAVAIPAGGYHRFSVPQGRHQVEVQSPQPLRHTVDVTSGYQTFGIPTEKEQCYVELNVTVSHYGKYQGPPPLPKVTQRTRKAGPWALPSTYYLSEEELPPSVQEKRDRSGKIVGMQLVHLFEVAPCEELDGPEPRLLSALGFQR